MGFLTQVVTAVVNATGGQGSTAGDWTEQQASNVDAAVDDATAAAQEGAHDATAFLQLLGDRMIGGVGDWIAGGPGRVNILEGIPLIVRGGLPALFDAAKSVGRLVGDRLEVRATSLFGRGIVGEVEHWAGVAPNGPAAIWHEVRGAVDSMTETARIHFPGSRTGAGGGQTPPDRALVEAASYADDERQRMLAEFRQALWILARTHRRGDGRIPHPLHQLYSRSGHGLELTRLSADLLGYASGGTAPPPNDEAARLLASAVNSAARAAVLHNEVLLWMAGMRKVTGRIRYKRRSPSAVQSETPAYEPNPTLPGSRQSGPRLHRPTFGL